MQDSCLRAHMSLELFIMRFSAIEKMNFNKNCLQISFGNKLNIRCTWTEI